MSTYRSSKTFLGLSADTGLPLPGKLAWLAANALSAAGGELAARAGAPAPRPLSPHELAPGPLEFREPSRRAGLDSSPGRLLAIHTTLRAVRLLDRPRRPMRVLDLGCGSGGFYPFFRDQFSDFRAYTGVDVEPRPSWDELAAGGDATFVHAEAEAFAAGLDAGDRFNLVHSNSALEHIHGDLEVLERVSAWARAQAEPVAQLHVVPASAALPLYRLHGYRVYSRRDVARLAMAMAPARTQVVGLGGARSFLLHLLGLRDRDSAPATYARRLQIACDRDLRHGRVFPIMWLILAIPDGWSA